ncbi:unnamed protein product [Paramecium pentaurelia]|uniref:Cytosolic endo-beta-N-acetylglucosaminidase TIM barrel domain-containing protein n=1 Tax=Paramecium pentaurelia TaxID=43138 RepID=A0A8S1TAI5_9CILI|nr:unnamed protein product [Paramecium pentaurelia]
MSNYFLNSGLKRDGQLKLVPEHVRFNLTQLTPSDVGIIQFQLILAEQEQNIIELIDIHDNLGNPLIKITLKQRELLIQYLDNTYKFGIQQIILYKLYPIFISFHDEISLITNFSIQSQKLQQRFTYTSNKVGIFLGSKSNLNAFTGITRNLQIRFVRENELKMQMEGEIKIQKSILNDLNDIGQIKYKLPFSKPLQSIEELDNWKPNEEYTILPIQQLKKITRTTNQPLLVCHDMQGGYKEDIWCFGNPMRQNSYRFYYMTHCDIFVYFSHTFITIPSVPYINICHQFGTRILGTIITEGEDNTLTNQILNLQYVDKLVQICQFYKFDGYLLNIETNVYNVDLFIQFIKELSDKLQQIGAILIYYDSHNAEGNLKWQSELNQDNMKYFQACNYFFSDYHWNLNKLSNTEKNVGNQRNNVFVGIDIWGRGQYGGGQFDSYIALQEIKRAQLATAIFGQAWTYETSNDSRSQFIQNDNSLWQGKNTVSLFDKHKNQWAITFNGGNGWKIIQENGEETAISSFDWCVRTYTIQLNLVSSNKGGIIQFNAKVKGTGPKFDDLYLIGIELYDRNNRCIASIDSFSTKVNKREIQFNVDSVNIADDKWREHTLSIKTTDDTQYVKFIEVGKDVEYWAGNYGTQFTGESMVYISYDSNKDLLRMLKPKTYQEFPLQTYFNNAVGEAYYIDGQKNSHYKGYYDNLNDFDYSLCYPTKKIISQDIQDNWESSINFSDSWNGSSCIKIKGDLQVHKSFLIKLYKTRIDPQGNINASINMKYFDKKILQLSLVMKFADKGLQIFKPTKILTNKGWDIAQYTILNQGKSLKSVYLKIENISQQQQAVDGLIGGLAIYDDKYTEQMKSANVDFKDPTKYIKNIQLKESITNLYDLYIQLELGELGPLLKTIRIFNDKQWIGNVRSNYAYFPELPFDGKEMFVRLQIVLNNGNHIKAESVLPYILYSDQVVRLP